MAEGRYKKGSKINPKPLHINGEYVGWSEGGVSQKRKYIYDDFSHCLIWLLVKVNSDVSLSSGSLLEYNVRKV